MKRRWIIKWHQIAISLLLGFALGTAFGQWHAIGQFHKRWEKKGDMKQYFLEKLDRDLRLSTDQRKQIEAVFEAKHGEMLGLQAEFQPKFEALRRTAQAEIRKLLDPSQQEKFDEISAGMEKRWKKRGHFPPPPEPKQ